MQDRVYLLSVAEFLEETAGEELMEQARLKVDESRRKKAGRICRKPAKAACLGAGLLVQLVVQEFGKESKEAPSDIHNKFIKYTAREALSRVEKAIPLEFTYGKNGKPFIQGYPFFFNLSHSGAYVVCAVSDREIGVDIQEHRCGDVEKIATRFFAPMEIQALSQCDEQGRKEKFFDMWAAKEAYGKYTGEGIAESLEGEIPLEQVNIQLIHSIPGYSLAICKAIEGESHEEIIEVSERL